MIKVSRWLHVVRKVSSPRLRLICFPYAGGGIRTYLPWAEALPADVELVAVQPPGRGAFLDTPAFNEMNALVSALYHHILPLLDRPYVLFGHSLGSRVAFELLVQLQRQQQALPELFIASGSNSPDAIRTKNKTFHLPDAEFIAELARMNGTPQEVLANAELMSLLLPLLRSDFEIAETYRYTGTSKFNCPIYILGGVADQDVPVAKLADWGAFFTGKAQVQTFADGHFFIESQQADVVAWLKPVLQGQLGTVPA